MAGERVRTATIARAIWARRSVGVGCPRLWTGYKLLPREVALSLDLKARGFELEPEITAKLLRSGHRIYEVSISYAARSRAEGKKLTAMDGVRAVRALARYRVWRPLRSR